MKRWIIAFFYLWFNSAYALELNQKVVLLNGSNVPSWVLSGASVDMDFANNRYYGCSLASCLSITRASAKTNLLPSSVSGFAYTTFGNNVLAIDSNGLLIEESRTNQLLNSTAPATQTTGSLGTGTYTLWVNGSGSAQMSLGTGVGCGVGTATNGTPVNFTITVAGTCIVTVIGSLNAFQLELGTFGTSLVVTAGATGTRAADSVSLSGTANTIMLGAQGTVRIAATLEGINAGNNVLTGGSNSATFGIMSNNLSGANGGSFLLATTNLCVASGSFTANISQKIIGSWKQANYGLSLNGASVITSVAGNTLVLQAPYFLGSKNSTYSNGYYSRHTLWALQLPNASLPGI